jgi:hypothetical protein
LQRLSVIGYLKRDSSKVGATTTALGADTQPTAMY